MSEKKAPDEKDNAKDKPESKIAKASKYYLHASAWGWNSSHRCGNLTENVLYFPRQIQRSQVRNYIACASGEHHSLLVSDQGIVYSFGDGRKGQLGYGNLFTGMPLKGGIVQAIPQSITPTGILKFGRDVQCVEVAAGSSFSFAREASPVEGSERMIAFLHIEKQLHNLLKSCPDSVALRHAWAQVRQERCIVNKFSEGVVIAWGTGHHGELGLGDEMKYSPYPQVIIIYILK